MSVVTRALSIPINSVGTTNEQAPPFGTEKMPNALRTAGLLDRLGLVDDGNVDVRLIGSHRHPTSGLTAWPSRDAATRTIRTAVSELVSRGERPLVLGGCCALVPGAVAGMRDALGTAAVVNIDGHLDLYDATTSPTGEAAMSQWRRCWTSASQR
jgi:arginase